MAQSNQIVPKYTFPYVDTVINDYTVTSDADVAEGSSESTVRYIFPFVSSKGIDNKFIKKNTRPSIVAAYGDTNWKKFGQPLMQALHVAEAANTEVWCMRVMPEDATYAHNIISAYYKADTDGTASERKFRIKYVQKTSENAIKNTKYLLAEAAKLDGEATDGVYTTLDGYTQIPGVICMYSCGRGKYGNNYSVRIGQDIYYEKDYGIKYYNFEVMSSERGLTKEAAYFGSHVVSPKYDQTTFITDLLSDTNDGDIPVFINIDEAGVEDLYNAYVDWATALVADLQVELESATDADKAKIEKIIAEASNIPELDEFDIFYGRKVASATTNTLIVFGEKSDDEPDVVEWDSLIGAQLAGGSDGAFETTDPAELQAAIDACYIKAFAGDYDKRINSPKRIKANALWDANYSFAVKEALAALALRRNDALCYLDCTTDVSFAGDGVTKLVDTYAGFADHKFSKNVHYYYIRESNSKKRVPVTITYYLARQYADHVMNYGVHVPFVKSYAQLTGHIKDSLTPSVEDFETDLKEILAENRFNFFETNYDNIYQRATQNTSQMSTSDLLEENNVATLYDIKRIVESDITDRLYDFSDAESRERFRNYERAKFADWSGREVASFDIDFRMNKWENERNILHCYIDVTFRGLQKRAILEIDVNKRPSVEDVVGE